MMGQIVEQPAQQARQIEGADLQHHEQITQNVVAAGVRGQACRDAFRIGRLAILGAQERDAGRHGTGAADTDAGRAVTLLGRRHVGPQAGQQWIVGVDPEQHDGEPSLGRVTQRHALGDRIRLGQPGEATPGDVAQRGAVGSDQIGAHGGDNVTTNAAVVVSAHEAQKAARHLARRRPQPRCEAVGVLAQQVARQIEANHADERLEGRLHLEHRPMAARTIAQRQRIAPEAGFERPKRAGRQTPPMAIVRPLAPPPEGEAGQGQTRHHVHRDRPACQQQQCCSPGESNRDRQIQRP